MDMPTNELRRRTLIVMLLAVVFSYPTAILMLGSRVAIETGNVIVLSVASGIVVAYAPVAWQAMRKGRLIDGADILSIGIFTAWCGVAYARMGSIIWRMLDKPVSWLDSGWWGFHIAMTCMGALCHLVAPEAVSGRVPTKEWIRIGLMVAAGVFCGAILVIINLD